MKKWLMFGLICIGMIALIVTIIFLSYKDFNQDWISCEIDEDCFFVPNPPCFCNHRVVNSKSMGAYNTHIMLYKAISLFQLRHVDCARCDKIEEVEPYCNLNKICSTRINCKKTCDLLEMKIKQYDNPEEINFYLNQSGCECDFS